jgi:metalloendopeptidase OMA1, mitochondrial
VLDDKQQRWKVHVIENAQPNAFVLPGGQIFVFTGILRVVQDEDGMAAVLGHEVPS